MFNRVLKDINLQLRSMWDKICTTKHNNSNVKGRRLVISMSRRATNGSGLIKVGNGGEHTFRHIFTYKNRKTINANFALMHVKTAAKELTGGEALAY